MGIKGLMRLIEAHAPNACKASLRTDYQSKFIAIDANLHLYQFLIQIRIQGAGRFGEGKDMQKKKNMKTYNVSFTFSAKQLMNKDGEVTSHLVGFLNRTTMLIENGITPIYVFDGKGM